MIHVLNFGKLLYELLLSLCNLMVYYLALLVDGCCTHIPAYCVIQMVTSVSYRPLIHKRINWLETRDANWSLIDYGLFIYYCSRSIFFHDNYCRRQINFTGFYVRTSLIKLCLLFTIWIVAGILFSFFRFL